MRVALESLFFVALILYSTAIWSHRLKGTLLPWMVLIFGIAFTTDALGTILLCGRAAGGWEFTLHTVSGLISLIIMGFHFLWALRAKHRGGLFERRFHRYSPWAWGLWLVSFMTGILIF